MWSKPTLWLDHLMTNSKLLRHSGVFLCSGSLTLTGSCNLHSSLVHFPAIGDSLRSAATCASRCRNHYPVLRWLGSHRKRGWSLEGVGPSTSGRSRLVLETGLGSRDQSCWLARYRRCWEWAFLVMWVVYRTVKCVKVYLGIKIEEKADLDVQA